MAVFPQLRLEKSVQTDDKTRLDASGSFVTVDNAAVTLVEIEPESGSGFIDVTPATPSDVEDYFLDWSYSGASRTVTVSVRITAGSTVTVTKDIEVITPADDKLFSDDTDIEQLEKEVFQFLPDGKNSFLYVHRECQRMILANLNNRRALRLDDQTKITKDEILNVDEVREWSRYKALYMIFRDISDREGDKFELKAREYQEKEIDWQHVVLNIDFDKDGTAEESENVPYSSIEAVRN